MLGEPRPEINTCVGDHLRDAISQAAELHDLPASEALTQALALIEQNTEYTESDFDSYADDAIAITE